MKVIDEITLEKATNPHGKSAGWIVRDRAASYHCENLDIALKTIKNWFEPPSIPEKPDSLEDEWIDLGISHIKPNTIKPEKKTLMETATEKYPNLEIRTDSETYRLLELISKYLEDEC